MKRKPAWLRKYRNAPGALVGQSRPTTPVVIGQINCPVCKSHWDLTDQDNISPNGGMLALPLHRAQETLDVARPDACPASEQLVRIQLN
jgi:hypothetical protein